MTELEVSLSPEEFRAARSAPLTLRVEGEAPGRVLARERTDAGFTGRWMVADVDLSLTSAGGSTVVTAWPPALASADVADRAAVEAP